MLVTAQRILEQTYDPAELRDEVLPELQAYWQPADTPCWLVSSALVANHTLLHVRLLKSPAPDGISQVVALDGRMEKHATLAVVVDLTDDEAITFVHDPVTCLSTLPAWRDGLTQLGEFALAHRGNRIRPGVLARCRLSSGSVILSGYFDQQLKLRSETRGDFAVAAQRLLKSAKFVRCDVQDIGHDRLMRRTAGTPAVHSSHKLATIGCGSLGSFLLDVVARHGVGGLFLLDKEILHPANLSRHVLGALWLYRSKAAGMAEHIRQRASETAVEVEADDFRSHDAWLRLVKFDARIVLMATGDTNAELTLSRACARGAIGACVFTWLEPNLSGAHLIFQPRCSVSIEDLHEATEAGRLRYRHRLVDRPENQTRREAGCQTEFTAYSGADVVLFAAIAARQLLAWLESPPDHRVVLRWTPASGWEECV